MSKDTIEGKDITFEEVMFTITQATQDVFKIFMDIDLFAGKVATEMTPLDSDVVAIVGVAGARVGYVMIAADANAAETITKTMMMMEETDPDTVRDAFGELANNIAGSFKSKYSEQYGNVAMGFPLVVSGKIKPMGGGGGGGGDASSSMQMQSRGAVIPFLSMEHGFGFNVMVYI